MNTKSIFPSLAAAGMAFAFASQPLLADTFDKFTYTNDGTAITITGYPTDATGKVVIPATIAGNPVTAVGYSAFYNCRDITGVTMPASITSIGGAAFLNCFGIHAVTIPSAVTLIGYSAFGSCPLTTVNIPANVATIGNAPFNGCTSLTSIGVNAANPHFTSVNGVLFNKAETTLIQYPGGKTGGYDIPAGVETIANSAFLNCTNLSAVTLPPGLTSIGYGAFQYCRNLTGVMKIPFSVTMIGDYSFYGCIGLTGIPIPGNVTSIGNGAFGECLGLTAVTFPASINNIGFNAFYKCSALSSATYLGNAPTMGAGVFKNVDASFTIHFITGSTGFTTPTWLGYPTVGAPAAPEIEVLQPAGSSLVDGASKKSFGSVKVGMSSNTKTFTIFNSGTAKLTDLVVAKNGTNPGNFIITQPVKTSINPGAATTFTVKFKPTATGTRTAKIHVKSNDADENPFDIKLTGMGVP